MVSIWLFVLLLATGTLYDHMYACSFILQSSFVFSVAPLEIIDGWRNQGIWETEVPNLGTGPSAASRGRAPKLTTDFENNYCKRRLTRPLH